MANYIDIFQEELEKEIVRLRIQENGIRHAFAHDHDMLFKQLGGPGKATELQHQLSHKRTTLEAIYWKVFDRKFEYRVFNEL